MICFQANYKRGGKGPAKKPGLTGKFRILFAARPAEYLLAAKSARYGESQKPL
jgi:hypothetical protein